MDTSDQDAIDLRDILFLLRRKLRLILFTIGIGLGIAAIYITAVDPRYTASTLILVDPSNRNLLDSSDDSGQNSRAANAFIESEVEILRSDATALAVIEASNLLSDPEFGPSLSTRDKILQAIGIGAGEERSGQALVNATLGRLKDAISVRRQGLTYLIEVSVTSESADRAAELANTMAEVYIEQQVDSKVTASLDARDVLKAQLDRAQASLAESESQLATYIENNLDRLARESGSDEIEDLRNQLLQAQSNRENLEETLAAGRSALEGEDWDTLTESLESEALAALESERQQLARRLGQTEAGTQEAIDLRAELEELEDNLEQEGLAEIQQLRQDVSTTRQITEETRDSIRRQLLSSDLSAETLSEIYALQQEASIARDQYDTLLARMRGLETQSLVEVANSRVVSQALPPNNASFPQTRLIIAMALVVSSGLGVGLAFLNEYYVGGITSEHQLASLIPATVAAVIPGVTAGSKQVSVADMTLDQPMSGFAESFRRLRASLDKRLPEREDGHVIMVTSAAPSEGKSTIALSLARTYAASGKRVLLIDADMRKPTLHKYLGAEPQTGLLNYLIGDEDAQTVEGFYVGDRISRLGVILGSRRSDVPTDQILQSERFTGMVSTTKNSFDIIVIDTPPLLPVVDARYVAPLADCTVMCVRFDETSQTDLRRAYDQLDEAMPENHPVLSVLNFHESADRGYRYGGYYGYAADS